VVGLVGGDACHPHDRAGLARPKQLRSDNRALEPAKGRALDHGAGLAKGRQKEDDIGLGPFTPNKAALQRHARKLGKRVAVHLVRLRARACVCVCVFGMRTDGRTGWCEGVVVKKGLRERRGEWKREERRERECV
jgi:hypothetical protein